MTKRERNELMAVYETLVLAESEAGHVELFTASNKETYDWARGYQDGVGKALDLLRAFLDMEG